MSDHERGPYTPPSDRLAFDPRQPERGGGPAPVTLIVSALVLALIVGGVFLVYRHGIRHRGEAPATVGTPVADMRSAPPPADAANAAPPGLVIDKSDAQANIAPAFAPPPEQPLPRPLATAPPPPPPPSVVTQPAAAAPKPAPVMAAKPPPAAPAARPPAARPASPLTIAGLADAALARRSPARAAAAPPPGAMVSAPAAGWVQIGAFSSAALADKGWHDTARFTPPFMAGKGLKVQAVSLNGRTFYRAFVTGFRSRDAAEAFCIKLKAADKPCIVR